MEITEVRIKLIDDAEDRLRGFCSITFDHRFVVRDLKIIEGNSGPFVAMPSRKLTGNCPKCGYKNHLRARYCNHCGANLPSNQVEFDDQGRAKLYADVAHPVNQECREQIQQQVIAEFYAELERAESPDYVSRYDESYDESAETPPATQSVDQRHDPPQPKPSGTHRSTEQRGKSSVTSTPSEKKSAQPSKSDSSGQPGRSEESGRQRGSPESESGRDRGGRTDGPQDEEFGRGILE